MRSPLRKDPLHVQTLTDGATINWETSALRSAVVTLAGDRTLAAATGHVAGHTYILRVVQDGTGSRDITWDSTYKFHADAVPELSEAASAEDTFIFVSDGTNMHCINAQRRGLAPGGHIDGCVLYRIPADAEHDIRVKEGEATMIESTTGETRVLAKVTGLLDKRLDADWAEGTGNGGIASGARTVADTMNVDTWYHYFIIGKTDGTVDAGADTNILATNLLSDASDYSFYRRVGSVLSDGSSNVTPFVQLGDIVLWLTPPDDINVTNVGSTNQQSGTLTVPFGLTVLALVNIQTVSRVVYIHAPSVSDLQVGAGVQSLPGVNAGSMNMAYVHTTADSTIRWRTDNTDGDLYLVTLGWLDPRGRALL
jgi:hypothetical protein